MPLYHNLLFTNKTNDVKASTEAFDMESSTAYDKFRRACEIEMKLAKYHIIDESSHRLSMLEKRIEALEASTHLAPIVSQVTDNSVAVLNLIKPTLIQMYSKDGKRLLKVFHSFGDTSDFIGNVSQNELIRAANNKSLYLFSGNSFRWNLLHCSDPLYDAASIDIGETMSPPDISTSRYVAMMDCSLTVIQRLFVSVNAAAAYTSRNMASMLSVINNGTIILSSKFVFFGNVDDRIKQLYHDRNP